MKKTNANPVPAKDAISHAAAEAAWTRLSEMSGPREEQWYTLVFSVLNQRCLDDERRDDEMALAGGIRPVPAQVLTVLGQIIALRRLSAAQLFELGSSEEAMQLCREALARGVREPAGDGLVLRFPRFRWVGDPAPKEAPPEKEEDETGTLTDEAGA
jgi:hypothetical protein